MTRNDFVTIINEKNYKTGTELGVAKGNFSKVLHTSNFQELVLIDKWNDHHDDSEKQLVYSNFGNDPRVKIIHKTFLEASQMFEDNYFDFIYIDGYAHTGQDNGLTLDIWFPKLKSGGFFGGHDYHPKWQPTIDIVNKFCSDRNYTIQLTDEENFPSWYIFK